MESGLIKVCVEVEDPETNCSHEWLWARPISEDTAKINNVPFFTKAFSLGDLVRFDRNFKVTEVLERGARTVELIYDADGNKAEVTQRFRKLATHLRSHEIHVEGMVEGLLVMAVPRGIDHEQLVKIADESGVACEVEPY